ncbi:MAG: hypothetical protein GY950_34595, partial [bacterium]|nr:hypothetical protein [bacterium]
MYWLIVDILLHAHQQLRPGSLPYRINPNGTKMALQKNILFIDTNKDSREEVLKAFVERENFHTLFETFFATKDSEALQILENTDIAVIVSDITMLQKDELRLLKSIKMRPRTKDIPIIVAGDTAGAELQTGDFEFRHIDYI